MSGAIIAIRSSQSWDESNLHFEWKERISPLGEIGGDCSFLFWTP